MSHRVILAPNAIRNFDDSLESPANIDYPFCNLGYYQDGGNYLFRGISIGDIKDDEDFGEVQTIKVKFVINGSTPKKLAENIARIWSVINPTIRYYDSVLKRTSTRSDAKGHAVALNTFLANTGVDTTLYSHSKSTGVLSVRPDGLDETACFDIIWGDLRLPSNFLNVQWGASKIVDAELELLVYAGGRGERANVRQIIKNGNFENFNNIPLYGKTWIYDENKFKVITRSTTMQTRYGSTEADKLKGKFGPSFMEFTNDAAFTGAVYNVIPEFRYDVEYNRFDKADGTGYQGEDLSYTPALWCYFYDNQFEEGYITAYVEVGVYNATLSNYDWVIDQQFVFIPSKTALQSKEWVQFIGVKKPFVGSILGATVGTSFTGAYRYRIECTAASNNVVGGFTGIAFDGLTMMLEPSVSSEAANVGAGEYACMDVFTSTYNLYGVRGDMEAEARIRTKLTTIDKGIAITSVTHNRSKYEEVPLPYTAEVTGSAYGAAGTPGISAITAQMDWIFSNSYLASSISDTNVKRKTFYVNVNADRIPRNYYCFVVYGADISLGNISAVTVNIGGEKTIFNTILPYTYSGGVIRALAYLGELQFPQPNGSSEEYVQTDTNIGNTRDTVQFDLVNPANTGTLIFHGLVFIPTDAVGTMDITGMTTPVGSDPLVNPYAYLIQSSETKSPSAALQIMPNKSSGAGNAIAPISGTKTPPIPLTSVVNTGTYVGGNFKLLPVINPENIREYEQITYFDIYSPLANNAAFTLGTGVDYKYSISIAYTPRFKYGTANYLKGSAKDSSSKSYFYAQALVNYNKVGYTPSNITGLAISNSGGANTVSFNFAVGSNPAPTHIILERRLMNVYNPINIQVYYPSPVKIWNYSGATSYSFVDNTDANGTWEYRVKIANANGVTYSNNVTQVVAGLPAAPSRLKITGIGAAGITPVLAWTDNSSGTASFKIERKTDINGTWSQVGTTAATVVGFTDNTATNGNLYYYRVRASNASGNSRYDTELDSARETAIRTAALTAQMDSLTKKWITLFANFISWKNTFSVNAISISEIAVRSNDNLVVGDAVKWAKLIENLLSYLSVQVGGGVNADVGGYAAAELKTIDTALYTNPLPATRFQYITPFGLAIERYNQFNNLRVYPDVLGGEIGYHTYANYFLYGPSSPSTSTTSGTPGVGLGYYRQFRHVKIYLNWELLQPVLGAALNATELAKVTTAISQFTSGGAIKTILCLNSNGMYNGTQLVVAGASSVPSSAALQDFWGRISDAYKANSNVDAYELMNEPQAYAADATPRTPVQVHNKLMQDVVTYLRTTKTDTKRLLIPAYYTNNTGSNIQNILSTHTSNFITDSASNYSIVTHANLDSTYTGAFTKTYDEENAQAIIDGY